MGRSLDRFTIQSLAVIVLLGGCAHGNGRSDHAPLWQAPWSDSTPRAVATDGRQSRIPSSPAPDAGNQSEGVVPAVAFDDPDSPGPVRLAAGVFESASDGVKQGMNKVTQAFTPAPPVTSSDDPTLLANKAKPTSRVVHFVGTIARGIEAAGAGRKGLPTGNDEVAAARRSGFGLRPIQGPPRRDAGSDLAL